MTSNPQMANLSTKPKWTNYTFMERFERKMKHTDRHAGSMSDVLIRKQFALPLIGFGIPVPILLIIMFLITMATVFAISKVKEDRRINRRLWLDEMNRQDVPRINITVSSQDVSATSLMDNHEQHLQKRHVIHQHVNELVKSYKPSSPSIGGGLTRRKTNSTPIAPLTAAIPTSWSALVNLAPHPPPPKKPRKPVLPTHQDMMMERQYYIKEQAMMGNNKKR